MVAASGIRPLTSGSMRATALRARVSIRICRARTASPNMINASGLSLLSSAGSSRSTAS
jgi:hypothetical protein